MTATIIILPVTRVVRAEEVMRPGDRMAAELAKVLRELVWETHGRKHLTDAAADFVYGRKAGSK